MPKSSHESVTAKMKELHWLPIKYRIIYKLLLTTHIALHFGYPDYLCNILELKNYSRNIRDTHKFKLVTNHYHSQFGHRSFKAAASKLWNQLPDMLRTNNITSSFKKLLKTHLFKAAYSL